MTSCESDVIDEITTEEETETRVENNILNRTTSTAEGLDLECLSIDYPFQFVTINENIIDINSEDDLENAFFDSLDYVIDFVYPLNVTLADGEAVIVNSIDELGEIFAECIPDEGWSDDDFPAFLIDLENSCYTQVYPLDLVDIQGETLTIANQAAFIDALAENDILFFQFPLSLLDEEGNTVQAENTEELFTLLASCEGIDGPCDSIYFGNQFDCYELIFPLDLVLVDGTTVTVENIDDYTNTILNGNVQGFGYPLSLLDPETEEVTVVENDDDLIDALLACGNVIQPDFAILSLLSGSEYCFSISFPLNVSQDGVTTEIADEAALIDAAFTGGVLEFPVTVTTNSDGVEHVLESYEDILALLEQC